MLIAEDAPHSGVGICGNFVGQQQIRLAISYARDDGPAVLLDAYRALFATVFGKMEMAEARLPHNCRERRLPFLLCRHRRKDAEARAGDDVLVKLAIDAPLDLVRKVLKYV